MTLVIGAAVPFVTPDHADAQSASFRSVDTNGDGVLDFDELVAAFGKAGATRILSTTDRNGDRRITISELRADPGDRRSSTDDQSDDDDDRDDRGRRGWKEAMMGKVATALAQRSHRNAQTEQHYDPSFQPLPCHVRHRQMGLYDTPDRSFGCPWTVDANV